MERVQTLCDKLNQQLSQKASPEQLLLTVQMLQAELLHLQASQPQPADPSAASVQIPAVFQPTIAAQPEVPGEIARPTAAEQPEEKIIQVLEVDEAELEAELEEIKRNAEERNKFSAPNKPALQFDPVEDTPTLTHQQPSPQEEKPKELHEAIAPAKQDSLNDRLKESKTEISDSLQEVSIRDLKKGIGVNDRFLFIRELFRGDETMYERSIKTINGFAIYPEAEYWIKRELKLKLGWDDRNSVVRQFDQLIRRRFS